MPTLEHLEPGKDVKAVSSTPPTSDDDGSASSWSGTRFRKPDQNTSVDTESLSLEDASSEGSSDLDGDHELHGFSPSPEAYRRRRLRGSVCILPPFPEEDFTRPPLESSRRDSAVDGKVHPISPRLRSIDNRRLLVFTFFVSVLLISSYCAVPDLPPPSPPVRFRDDAWTLFMEHDAVLIRKAIRNSPADESFTIRLTGSRLDLIQRSLESHAHCEAVDQVQVDWQSELRLPRKISRHASGKVTTVDAISTNAISTNAVLLLDEDVVLTCNELERAFSIWRKNRDRMVGFFPVAHSNDDYSIKAVRRGETSYSLVSSRAAFVHKLYANSYSPRMKKDSCQSLTMSIHCSAISSKPPMVVAARPQELRTRERPGSSPDQSATATCLREWIEGHGMASLPWESATYIGQ